MRYTTANLHIKSPEELAMCEERKRIADQATQMAVRALSWRNVADCLPLIEVKPDEERNDNSLLLIEANGNLCIGWYRGVRDGDPVFVQQEDIRSWCLERVDVEYWMPIPELPKEKRA